MQRQGRLWGVDDRNMPRSARRGASYALAGFWTLLRARFWR